MKNSKTFKLILLLLILIIAYLTIKNTYSKYVTEADNYSRMNISNWNIKLNDEDIANKADFTGDINIEYEKSDHITDGVIVPTSKGKFSLSLESTGTELPYEYIISMENQNNIADFRITSYTINGVQYTMPATETSITGTVIPPTDITEEVKKEFEFTIEWYDQADNILDNYEDVQAYKNGLSATIPIKIKINQVLPN